MFAAGRFEGNVVTFHRHAALDAAYRSISQIHDKLSTACVRNHDPGKIRQGSIRQGKAEERGEAGCRYP